jgi:hypothetical protein
MALVRKYKQPSAAFEHTGGEGLHEDWQYYAQQSLNVRVKAASLYS